LNQLDLSVLNPLWSELPTTSRSRICKQRLLEADWEDFSNTL